jgi:cell division septation protein DedD
VVPSASIHKIYSAFNPATKGVPHTQERAVETLHRGLVDKGKQAKHKEINEQATNNTAAEDAAKKTTEEDKAEEMTVEDAKPVSARGRKHAKKNGHAMESKTSKKPAKRKATRNQRRRWEEMICW